VRYGFITQAQSKFTVSEKPYPLAINDVNNGGDAAGHGAVVDHHNSANLDESSERLWKGRAGREK
jgi:hypothetical protein